MNSRIPHDTVLPHLISASLELRLNKADDFSVLCQDLCCHWGDQAQRNERYIDADEVDGFLDLCRIQIPYVAFFDIDPESAGVVKDITVNYNGVDYSPCTIKFAPDNGSWRIQLKGSDADNQYKIHLIEGLNWLQHKILVFEKITTDYYVMSSVPEDELDTISANSYVVATNGINARSKKYGLLR